MVAARRPGAGRALRAIVSLSLLGITGVAACKEAADPARAAQIVGMNVTDSVRVGKTFTFEIELRDASGNKVTGRRVTWSSLNPNVASVDQDGVVTGLIPGTTIITGRVDDATAQTNMLVQAPVASVVLFPAAVSVPLGTTRQLTVAVSDKDGKAIPGRLVAFSSSNPSVATVNSSGVVVGVTKGNATIIAEAVLDQVSGTAAVEVVDVPVSTVSITPAGAQTVFEGLTLQLSAVLRDNNGAVITGRPVSWTTSNQSIATVSSTGLVTGVALGNVQITAEAEGKFASSPVTVAPRPAATVSVSPNPGSVRVGGSLQMSLDLRDASGNPLTPNGRTIVWTSSNNPVATVNTSGVVAGVSPGSASITATVDGKPASALVNVTP